MIDKRQYNSEEIQLLEESLIDAQIKGKPKAFKIWVDALEVVARTDNADEFCDYEKYVKASTKSITIIVYSGAGNSGKKYIYSMESQDSKAANLDGLTLQKKVDEAVLQYQHKIEFESLKKENSKLKKERDECQAYADELEALVTSLKERKHHLGNIDLGSLLSATFDGMLKRNPKLVEKVPLIGGALAGAYEPEEGTDSPAEEIGEDTIEPEAQNDNSKVTDFVKELTTHFDQSELPLVIQIISLLAQDKPTIKTVLELLSH